MFRIRPQRLWHQSSEIGRGPSMSYFTVFVPAMCLLMAVIVAVPTAPPLALQPRLVLKDVLTTPSPHRGTDSEQFRNSGLNGQVDQRRRISFSAQRLRLHQEIAADLSAAERLMHVSIVLAICLLLLLALIAWKLNMLPPRRNVRDPNASLSQVLLHGSSVHCPVPDLALCASQHRNVDPVRASASEAKSPLPAAKLAAVAPDEHMSASYHFIGDDVESVLASGCLTPRECAGATSPQNSVTSFPDGMLFGRQLSEKLTLVTRRFEALISHKDGI